MILAGDVGGTKAVLALYDDRVQPVREQIFHCAELAAFEEAIDRFFAGAQPPIAGACFGVAGPVVGGVAKITNLPWTISAEALASKLGAPVTLLNDLQATALGMLVLAPTQLAMLQPAEREPRAGEHPTIAVIAPGTGLGEATLYHDGTRYVALPSEGGHADFAPGTDEELELWKFLRGKHGGHVSVERVLCGAGLGDLYDFCRANSGVAEPAWLTAELAAGDRNAAVANVGLAHRDPACGRALAMFAELLGAEAGNCALRSLAHGGVAVGGGIPPKILAALQAGGFIARFNAKGRFGTWTRSLAVRVSLEPRAALLGAAHHVKGGS
jgi:glucokinase